MFIKILIVAVVVFGGFLTYVAVKPAASNISREIVIGANPETLFPYINNSKKMADWMPWQDSDPGVKMQYSGPDEGVGSKSSWNSEGKMGVGNAVIIESTSNKSVKTQLTYTKPMEMAQLAEVTLTPVDGGTKVKWSVDGHNGFMFRLMGIIMNVEKMVGGEFEKGLAKLKNTAEASQK
jgi:uncharacterized protein YndB with AHSA1/START domain